MFFFATKRWFTIHLVDNFFHQHRMRIFVGKYHTWQFPSPKFHRQGFSRPFLANLFCVLDQCKKSNFYIFHWWMISVFPPSKSTVGISFEGIVGQNILWRVWGFVSPHPNEANNPYFQHIFWPSSRCTPCERSELIRVVKCITRWDARYTAHRFIRSNLIYQGFHSKGHISN